MVKITSNCDTLYRLNHRLDKNINKIKTQLSEQEQQTLSRFVERMKADDLSTSRIIRCVLYLRDLHKFLDKDLHTATRDDLIAAIAKVDGKGWSPHTVQGLRVFAKKFYKWLRNTETYPPEVSWIKTSINKSKLKLPQVLTEEEIAALGQACINTRDKAFILCLYEGGCRIGEFLPLQRKDISFDQYGAILNVHGKTGGRRVRIVQNTRHLTKWLEDMGDKRPDTFVWQKKNGSMLGAGYATKTLKTAATKIGLQKRIHPHLLRHTRATHLADKVSESVLKEFFGWGQGSKMTAVYVHIAGTRTDNAILRANGVLLENAVLTSGQITLAEFME